METQVLIRASGRVNVIAFHPTNTSTIFAGTPSGGLWKTTNDGASWFPLTDGIPSLGVSGIAVHNSDGNIIYILTGDGNGSHSYSTGVLKSTDGGFNWTSTGLVFDVRNLERGFRLIMHPFVSDILIAATTDGIYRTIDGGDTWTREQVGSFRDLEYKPGDPTTVYACTSDLFYRSFDSGDTWSASNSGLPTSESRSAIAVTGAEPDYIYYIAGPGGPASGQFKGIYRSTDEGDSWSLRTTTPNILGGEVDGSGTASQATFALALAVDPDDAEEIITGGINIWRDENNGGSSLSIISHWNTDTQTANNLQYTHADIQELLFQNNNTVWCASAGGIFRSTNDGLSWTDMSSVGSSDGLMNMHFYRIADYPSDQNILIGGSHDNGSNRWDGGDDVTHFDGDDGMDCMIDFNNSDIQYHSRPDGALRKSIDAGVTHSSIRPGSTPGAFVTPYAMDPNNSSILYAGYRDTIYRSTNAGNSWSEFVPASQSEFFKSIWISPSNSDMLYAATDNFIYRSANGGAAWLDITGTLPVLTTNITGIVTDVDNSSDVWVSLSGYVSGEKVYYSSDGGNIWTNISGSLPNVPVNCVVYDDVQGHDNAVYLGTDIGIFYSNGSMNDWVPFMNGLPNVPVYDLEVHIDAGKLRAATFGRGIWETSVYSDCPSAYVLADGNLPGTGSQGYRSYQASDFIQSTRNIEGGIGTEVHYKAGNFVTLLQGFEVAQGSLFEGKTGPCSTGIPNIPLTDDSSPAASTSAVALNAAQLLMESEHTATLSLPKAGIYDILITDRKGREVELIQKSVSLEKGKHEISLEVFEGKMDGHKLIARSGKLIVSTDLKPNR